MSMSGDVEEHSFCHLSISMARRRATVKTLPGNDSPYTLAHRNAHRPQQQNRGRHGDEPQPPIQAEHRQAHQQDRAEEKQEVGHEDAVARWRPELDRPDIVHDDHERNEGEVHRRTDPLQPAGSRAHESDEGQGRRDCERDRSRSRGGD